MLQTALAIFISLLGILIDIGIYSIFFYLFFKAGWHYLDTIRQSARGKAMTWRILSTVFQAPIGLYVFLHILSRPGYIHKCTMAACVLGFLFGIFMCFDKRPSGPDLLRIIVKEHQKTDLEVWFDSVDVKLPEVIEKIKKIYKEKGFDDTKELLEIESGKGKSLNDDLSPLLQFCKNTATVDFFGYTTMSVSICRTLIKIKEPLVVNSVDDKDTFVVKNITSPFWAVIPRYDSFYGELYTMSCKPPTSSLDTHYLTSVRSTNESATQKIAGKKDVEIATANGDTQTIVTPYCVAFQCRAIASWPHFRILPFREIPVDEADRAVSENGDLVNVSSADLSESKKKKSFAFFAKKKRDALKFKSDECIRNGDIVVLEKDGLYLDVFPYKDKTRSNSVSSKDPKDQFIADMKPYVSKSSAFRIQLVEKLPVLPEVLKQVTAAAGNKIQTFLSPSSSNNASITRDNIENFKADRLDKETGGNFNTAFGGGGGDRNNNNKSQSSSNTPQSPSKNGARSSTSKDSNSGKDSEPIIMVEEFFRLISVKRPDYELALTNIAIKKDAELDNRFKNIIDPQEDFWVLGLRRMVNQEQEAKGCTQVLFSLKKTPMKFEEFGNALSNIAN